MAVTGKLKKHLEVNSNPNALSGIQMSSVRQFLFKNINFILADTMYESM